MWGLTKRRMPQWRQEEEAGRRQAGGSQKRLQRLHKNNEEARAQDMRRQRIYIYSIKYIYKRGEGYMCG